MGFTSVVVEGILLIAAVIAASVFAVAFLTKMSEVKETFLYSMKASVARVKTKVVIAYATYDSSQGLFLVYAKNVGQYDVLPIDKIDVYFGSLGKASLYSYDYDGVFSAGEWSYVELSGKKANVWEIGETIEIKIYNATTIDPPYYVKIVLPYGESVEETFSEVPT